MPKKKYDAYKRAIDVCVAASGLIVTMPIQLLIAGLVYRNLGSPVLFKQARPGKDGEIFELLKFRSMRNVDESRGWVTNEQRITRFGDFLRSSSLDEIPSLFNILRGDMSLIGPRPLLVNYLPLYSQEQSRRHEIRPGLTGLAQVNGRNKLDWNSRFRLDVEYVDNRSFGLDLKILWKTIIKVLRRDGISSEGHVVGAPFQGSQSNFEQKK